MLNMLVRGNKYTLIGNDGFLEFNLKIILVDYIYKQYAQFGDVPYITYRKRGSNRVYSMYLNYKYTFIEDWKDIELSKRLNYNTYTRIKYNDLKLENIEGFVLNGEVGKCNINNDYESLLDYSFNLYFKYGKDINEYINNLKKFFTEKNYSYNKELIEYYKHECPKFLSLLDKITS